MVSLTSDPSKRQTLSGGSIVRLTRLCRVPPVYYPRAVLRYLSRPARAFYYSLRLWRVLGVGVL